MYNDESFLNIQSGKMKTCLLTLLFLFLLLRLWKRQDVCGFCQGNELQDTPQLYGSPKNTHMHTIKHVRHKYSSVASHDLQYHAAGS